MYLQYCRDKKGVALVTALLMMVISLAIVIAALYLITRGTTVSSLTRQYHTAHEAAYGAADFFTKELADKVISGTVVGTYNGMVNLNDPNCLQTKLRNGRANWVGCSQD